jgi:regulator of sigma E protease
MTIEYLIDKVLTLEKPDVAGPIGVVWAMADAAKSGAWDYLKFVAMISVALGLFNLLPIPMVDGGMILLFLVEGIIGNKINAKVVQIYNIIGLVFIVCIFIFATYSDLLIII